MAGWLAGDEEADWGITAVDGLMKLTRRDFEAFVRLKYVGVTVDNQRERPGQDVEELARMDVVVRRLGRARGHPLFDDIEAGRADEVPGVAIVSPGVVVGIRCADDVGGMRDSIKRVRGRRFAPAAVTNFYKSAATFPGILCHTRCIRRHSGGHR